MRIPLDVVTFDSEVYGPGPKQQATNTATFARSRVISGGRTALLDIVHDTERQAVVIRMPDADTRPCIVVPWARVRSCEPSPEPTQPQQKETRR